MAHKHKMTEKQARGLKLQMLGELVICNHCQERVHKKHYNQHLVSFHSDVEKTVECQVCSWRFISGWCDLTNIFIKEIVKQIHFQAPPLGMNACISTSSLP